MQTLIRPAYTPTLYTCTCGNTINTQLTDEDDTVSIEVCNQCHPYYTGRGRIMNTFGRIEMFNQRYGKTQT